ncbi:polymorphic toxin-type HINT domain-containing protein [Streptomyces sp. C10]|uniref:polymorphic toxin-type HINT domain-containing protein n=1 Tax=Streptomyces sp. C10 TaxID=531941 RepID=UPI0039810088
MAGHRSKPIEDIRTGDRVIATDPRTGRTAAKRVQATITGLGRKDLVRVTITGPDARTSGTVTATGKHPFWAAGGRNAWRDAEQLKPGERLLTEAGSQARIDATRSWTTSGQRVHNLTVAGLHTYYVLAGRTPVLVHNASCEFIPGDIPDAANIDRGSLVKMREKQLEKALESLDEDPHGFNADWVGKNDVSRLRCDARRQAHSCEQGWKDLGSEELQVRAMSAFRMYLRVVSDSLQPEDISRRLGAQPDDSTSIGSRRHPQSPPRSHATWIRWAATANGCARPEDLEPVVVGWGPDLADALGRLGRLWGGRCLSGDRSGDQRPRRPAAEGHSPRG